MTKNNISWKDSDFYTHVPVLKEILAISSGSVVEFGCGHGSTPLVNKYANDKGIKCYTFDSNPEWIGQFTNYNGDYHKIIPIEDSLDSWEHILFTKILSIRHISLAFIDQSPWEARVLCLDKIKQYADYVILHDCDYFPRNGLLGKPNGTYSGDFSDVFKYHQVFDVCRPPTLVGSMYRECNFKPNWK